MEQGTGKKPLVEGLVLKLLSGHCSLHCSSKPLVEGLVLKLHRRCGAWQTAWKPLVEGLVLKFRRPLALPAVAEAPRGGAGIEIESRK